MLALLGSKLAADGFTLKGVTAVAAADGTAEIRIEQVEAASLRIAPGPLVFSPHAAGSSRPDAWSLGPLAAVNGTIGAQIADAQLLFDADVAVPIRDGQVDFNQATVEHVGPDSRMGVSRMGVYVDAPNGRSYLLQFPSAAVAGVAYERRGALLGARVSDRGSLQLQPFIEGLLRQGPRAHGLGLTEQSRLLFDRTAVSGEIRLGDGRLAAPGVEANFVGRAQGRNTVRIHSQAVGRGLTLEVGLLSVRDVSLKREDMTLRCAEASGAVVIRVSMAAGQPTFELELAGLKAQQLAVRFLQAPTTPAPGATPA